MCNRSKLRTFSNNLDVKAVFYTLFWQICMFGHEIKGTKGTVKTLTSAIDDANEYFEMTNIASRIPPLVDRFGELPLDLDNIAYEIGKVRGPLYCFVHFFSSAFSTSFLW